jgi:hypothetical protein
MKKILIIMMLALLLLASVPATANTIQMSNPDGTGQRDIIVYYANGSTLFGVYNTTSLITLDTSNNSYIFTLKPQGNSLIDDPGDWLTDTAFPYVQANFLYLIILFALMAILVARR